MRLAAHLQLVPKLRVSETIYPLPFYDFLVCIRTTLPSTWGCAKILHVAEIRLPILSSTVELHLSGLIEMASHPDLYKIRIIGFFFESSLHWQFEVRLLILTYVSAFKPCNHACFEVPEATTLYCTRSNNL